MSDNTLLQRRKQAKRPRRRPPHPRDEADAKAAELLDWALTAARRGRRHIADDGLRRLARAGYGYDACLVGTEVSP